MMKIGANGASSSAAVIGLAIVWRTVSRSRIAWPLAGPPTVIMRCSTSGAIRVSSRMLARTSNRDRTASSALKRQQRDDQRQGDEQQGRLAPGRHHPVIDLQHVERRREEQDVDQQTEPGRRREMRPAGTHRVGQRLGQLDPGQRQCVGGVGHDRMTISTRAGTRCGRPLLIRNAAQNTSPEGGQAIAAALDEILRLQAVI